MKKKTNKIINSKLKNNKSIRSKKRSSVKSSPSRVSVTKSLNFSVKSRPKHQQINFISKYDTGIKSDDVLNISEAITKKYDFSKLSRGERLYIQFNRCGICLNYASLSYPSNLAFCCNCETIVHLTCLNLIPKLDKSKLNLVKCFPSSYKGRYISTVKFEYQFTCEKCSDIQAK